MAPPKLTFHPPLLNSACPWATTTDDLAELLTCPSTGAITVRTSLLKGFTHNDAAHRYLFFDPATSRPAPGTASGPEIPPASAQDSARASASLNSLGYSYITLPEYLDILGSLAKKLPATTHKTVIVSVTGSAQDVRGCLDAVVHAASSIPYPLAVEINLSCPNIPGSPPPAYDGPALADYLALLPDDPPLPVGIKTPPYTHAGQFNTLITELLRASTKISFITATNTLGSCLILDEDTVLPGHGIGGMAGPPLHPLALGNVSTMRRLLDEAEELRHVQLIGVGGVSDAAGYKRFRQVGAFAVAVGTALGKKGTAVFGDIEKEMGGFQ